EPQQEKIDQIYEWVSTRQDQGVAESYHNFLKYSEPVYHAHLAKDYTNGNLADTKWMALRDNGSCYIDDVHTQGGSFMYMKFSSETKGTTMTIRRNNAQSEILSRFTLERTNGRSIQRFPFKRVDGKVDLYIEAHNDQIAPTSPTSYISWFAFLPDI